MAGLGLVKDKRIVTVDSLKEKFPKKKGSITDETARIINEAIQDPMFNGYSLMDTLIDYEDVMYKNKSNMIDYLNAIKFCAFIEGESANYVEAYKLVFRDRDFVIERANEDTTSNAYRELTSAASRYRKSPMVQSILTKADIPLYLMFQGMRYKAVELLGREMINAPFSKDRISAADKLLTHVKPPENMQIELAVGMSEDAKESQSKLYDQMKDVALGQQKLLEQGYNIEDIQKLNIKQDSGVMEADIIEED